MKIFSFSFFLSMACFLVNSLQAMQDDCITFETMKLQDALQVKQRVTLWYANELFKSKSCATWSDSLVAARKEFNPDKLEAHEQFVHIFLGKYEKPIGYIWYDKQENPDSLFTEYKAYIKAFYINKDFSSKGTPKTVLNNFEMMMRQQNVYAIATYVFERNMSARYLYKILNYEVAQLCDENDKIILEKQLKSDLQFLS